MIHVCHEEIFALMAVIPVLRHVVPYIHSWWHRLWKSLRSCPSNRIEPH